MRADDLIAQAITKAAEAQAKRATRVRVTTLPAEYVGRDSEGKSWVLLPGATSPTPVRRMAVEADLGDTVSVTVGNGRAVVDSNISNPSAGVVGVRQVRSVAQGAQLTAEGASKDAQAAIGYASSARLAAKDAKNQAESATTSAATANEAANRAQADAATANAAAESAVADAATASESAAIAVEQANSAIESAWTAQNKLSDVERVVGTVNWIAEHGEYVNQAGQQFDASKVYYTRSGSGTTQDPYVYTVVPEPVAADIASYYVLRVDESVQNYINSHLWLDDYGLNLSVDSANGWRVHQGTVDGTKVLGTYILDPSDNIVMTMNASGVQVGKSGESHLELDYHSMQLIDKEDYAYFHVSDLRDSDGYITDSFTGDGSNKTFEFATESSSIGTVTVTVDGTEVTSGVTKSTVRVVFSAAPASGSVVKVRYEPLAANADRLKAYSFGRREPNRKIGLYSTAEGSNTEASGSYSHAEGFRTTASGIFSHAEGNGATASGENSHAEGNHTHASGRSSHAEGYGSVADGYASHAEVKAFAYGTCSHAEGFETYTDIDSEASHAEGYRTFAYGNYSHAQNLGTIAMGDSQTVIGKYNIEDSENKYAAIIGNGTADDARSNALAVRWNGLVDQAGETAYPTFVRSSWSTSSDESTLPVTPCFVLSTSDMALYYCSGA